MCLTPAYAATNRKRTVQYLNVRNTYLTEQCYISFCRQHQSKIDTAMTVHTPTAKEEGGGGRGVLIHLNW